MKTELEKSVYHLFSLIIDSMEREIIRDIKISENIVYFETYRNCSEEIIKVIKDYELEKYFKISSLHQSVSGYQILISSKLTVDVIKNALKIDNYSDEIKVGSIVSYKMSKDLDCFVILSIENEICYYYRIYEDRISKSTNKRSDFNRHFYLDDRNISKQRVINAIFTYRY